MILAELLLQLRVGSGVVLVGPECAKPPLALLHSSSVPTLRQRKPVPGLCPQDSQFPEIPNFVFACFCCNLDFAISIRQGFYCAIITP